VTDGAPALALGLDPTDAGVMTRPPRPRAERVITSHMWGGILVVGATMAAATLFTLDLSLPGGLVGTGGGIARAQTMAFTTLVLAQLVNVFNARSDHRSAFAHLFVNRWLWIAILASLVLQAVVLYVPVLQRAFGTVALGGGDWLRCALAASAVLWVSEALKAIRRRRA
jgi:Ca2+-transporting ATPase